MSDVDDFFNKINRTSKTCYQHDLSPASVTNIDVTNNLIPTEIDVTEIPVLMHQPWK